MKINSNISCTVDECTYNVKGKDFCSLEKILVVKNTDQAKDKAHTDCHSFESTRVK